MWSLLLVLALAQPGSCDAAMGEASALARALDLSGAVARLQTTGVSCTDARIAAAYLAGLQAAREAYAFGGDDRSLAPVRNAQEALAVYAGQGVRTAEIARVVLMAAAAAAQSERNDVGVFLEHAVHLESVELIGGRAAAPLVSAHEVAGDLWLQVHRFAAAREAYQAAERGIGPTPRVLLGLARTAVRLEAPAAACEAYRRFLATPGDRLASSDEAVEARTYVASPGCTDLVATGR